MTTARAATEDRERCTWWCSLRDGGTLLARDNEEGICGPCRRRQADVEFDLAQRAGRLLGGGPTSGVPSGGPWGASRRKLLEAFLVEALGELRNPSTGLYAGDLNTMSETLGLPHSCLEAPWSGLEAAGRIVVVAERLTRLAEPPLRAAS